MADTDPKIIGDFSDATKKAFTAPVGAPVKKAEENTPAGDPPNPPAGDPPPAPVAKTWTDEDFEAELAKRSEGRLKKIDDLKEPAPTPVPPTPEEIEAAAKEKKKNSLAWAIANEKVKQEDLDRAAVVASKSDREIALDLFAQDARESDPKLSDEEIEEAFKDHYREELDDTDPIRVRHLKNMAKIVAGYKSEVSGKVGGIESEYDNYVSNEQAIKTFNKQVNAVVKDELPKKLDFEFKYNHPDGTEHTVSVSHNIDEKIIDSMRKSYLNNEGVYNAIKGNKKEIANADIINAAMYNLRSNVFNTAIPELLAQAANQARIDTEAHYKNVPVRRTEFPINTPERTTDKKKAAQEFSTATNKAFTPSYN